VTRTAIDNLNTERLTPPPGIGFPVVIAEGSHLVPFRTQKLSPPAPMVLPWRRGGRVGRRRISQQEPPSGGSFYLMGWGGLGFRSVMTQQKKGPQPGRGRSEPHASIHLSDEIVRELHATARTGKGGILVKVFSEAAASFAEGDYEDAARLGEQAKHIALRAASVRELLGLALYRLGRWKDAASELSAFRRISGSPEQNPVIADSYRAMGKPERALELCAEVRMESVGEAVYFENVIVGAGALADMDKVEEAIKRLQALTLDPPVAREHHLRAWYALGDLLERRGRFTQAFQWFSAVLAADPDLTDAQDRIKQLNHAPRRSE
jgi:hypothetical protein